ncbi:MAG: hypothetical protein RLZZ262_2052 [Bacteroidota bacterium]|jgi:hypothetical protein
MRHGFTICLLLCTGLLIGQCTNYTVYVTVEPGCSTANQISWQLLGSDGTMWLSGGSNFNQVVCLNDDCYTLNMLDTGGDGWDCVDWFIEDFIGDFDWDTNLPNGNFGTDTFELGAGDCNGGGNGGCASGTEEFNLQVSDGDFPAQISWEFTLGGAVVMSGGANADVVMCLASGCYLMEMADAAGNGWNDAFFNLEDSNGNVIASGTLTSGSSGYAVVSIGGLDCTDTTPGGGGGGGSGPGGGACGNQIPTADCVSAACACDGFSFALTPTGSGTFADVPSPGSTSNPSFGGGPPWGGTDAGCLLAGELNSHWITFTIASSGTLAFSFGQNSNGGQFGFYDWSMWPYNGLSTCSDIANNLVPPARCLWNATTVGGTGLASPVPAGGNPGNYGPPLNVVAGQQFVLCLSNYSYVTANVVLDFFGTASIQCASVLATEAVHLEGRDVQGHLLNWQHVGEMPILSYELQRSTNGQVWEVEWRTRDGNEETRRVVEPFIGDSYYRVKAFLSDGSYLFSNTIAMDYVLTETRVFPNPCNEYMIVRGAVGCMMQVHDMMGNQVFTGVIPQSGQLQCDTRLWSTGMYSIRTGSLDEQHIIKLVVEH